MHICKLSDYFEITSSKRVFKSEWTQDGIPFYRAREIVKISKNEKFKDPIFISNNHYQEVAKKYGVPKIGDLLISISRNPYPPSFSAYSISNNSG